jgi:hypothetical protein
MDLDALRRIAQENQKKATAEYEQTRQRREEAATQAKWAAAREAVNHLEKTLVEAANRGNTIPRVYSAPKGEGRMAPYPCDDWDHVEYSNGRTIPYTGRVPDYGRFVYDECLRQGLKPRWESRKTYDHSDIFLVVYLT